MERICGNGRTDRRGGILIFREKDTLSLIYLRSECQPQLMSLVGRSVSMR